MQEERGNHPSGQQPFPKSKGRDQGQQTKVKEPKKGTKNELTGKTIRDTPSPLCSPLFTLLVETIWQGKKDLKQIFKLMVGVEEVESRSPEINTYNPEAEPSHEGWEGRSSPQETRAPAPWASSGCLQSAEGTKAWGSQDTLSTPFKASLLSSSGDGWASPWVDSQCQTYLDTLRGAEDIDDSLGHIFGFETLRVPGESGIEMRAEWIQVPCTTEVLSSIHIPTPTLQEGQRAG